MTKRFLLFFMLPAVAMSPFARSQSATGSSAGSTQSVQNSTAANCLDASLVPGEECFEDEGQNPQAGTTMESTIPTPATLGVAPTESMTTNQQTSARTQTRTETFPPDQPTEFQRFVAETTGQFLPVYGSDLFRRVPTTFSPSDQAPVPSNYVIGPDDELRVRIWGQIRFSGNLRVDRSGSIYLPQVGTVSVAGLQFSTLDQHLRAAIAKIYRNFDLSVEIGRIRSIQVYIAGQARRPGAYTISSLSSLVDALFATGGPSPQGSLRHVLLRREGKDLTDFDLYAFLINGDKSKDVRLLPEDVIYIPPAGAEVAITGSIRHAAIYEVRSGETIKDLIELAGRTTAVASNSRISLERVSQHQMRSALEFEFNDAGLGTILENGDILRINSILPAYDKSVTLRGSVANPGHFSWHEGMKLSELIPDSDSLISRDYWWKRSHLGLPAPEFEPLISSLGQTGPSQTMYPRSLNGQQLQSGQMMPLPPKTQTTLRDALTQQDQQVSDETMATDNTNNNTDTNTNTNTNANPGQRGSNATMASEVAPGQNKTGAAATPLNDVHLSRDQINWNYAVIERIDPKSLKTSLLPFDLGKLVLEHDAKQDLELQPGDTVTIFSQTDIRVPFDEQVKYVKLEGEVAHPGFYSVQTGETLRDVVRRAGGLTPKAYLYGSEFTRESTRILQQQRLNDYVRDLTLEAERGTQALAMTASSSSTSSSDVASSREVTTQMIDRLMQLKATGRIVLQFQPKSTVTEDLPLLSLENGDKFVVPFRPSSVNVVGAVYDQNSYVFEEGKKLSYYLNQAGGPNRNADWRNAFLIRADGSVVSRKHVKNSGILKKSFEDVKLNPGDTIVMPDKVLRPTALRGFMEWSQIFSQLAIGAAVVNDL